MMTLTLRRFDKLSHADTILYEMNMLRFAAKRLDQGKWEDEKDAWVYLESFLLHYRSLLEFFGKLKPSATDVNVKTIWQMENLQPPPSASLDAVHSQGTALFNKYEPPDAAGGGRISQYLQHCTMKRIDFKEWPIDVMCREIEPLIKEVAPYLMPRATADFAEILSTPETVFLTRHSASTAVSTSTAVAMIKPFES